MTQKEKDTAIAWHEAEIQRLQIELEHFIATTDNVKTPGERLSSHSKASFTCKKRIGALLRRINNIKQQDTTERSEEVQQQINALEIERDAALAVATTEEERKHIRRSYNCRLGCLRHFGAVSALARKDVIEHTKCIKQERYGHPNGPVERISEIKLQKYGHIYGPDAAEHACQSKELIYGNRSGNTKKSQDTKRKRYGNIWGDADKIRATKLERYGNAAGIDTELMQQKYGVPFFCMHQKCRSAHKNVISATNKRWQALLLQELGLAFDCDDVNIERHSYDLHYKHLLIEICPTISHNSTYGYAYAIGKSKHNCPLPFDYHFNKTQLALKHGYTCITVFDWMTPEQVVNIIKQHLDKTIDSTDFCFNPQQSIDKSTICKHWTKLNSKEHIADIGQDDEQMIADGYVAVYDCGHAKLLADDCGHC